MAVSQNVFLNNNKNDFFHCIMSQYKYRYIYQMVESKSTDCTQSDLLLVFVLYKHKQTSMGPICISILISSSRICFNPCMA